MFSPLPFRAARRIGPISSTRCFSTQGFLLQQKQTPTEQQQHRKVEEKGTQPAAYLSRALGVHDPPVSVKPKLNRQEWEAKLLSRERRINERKHIIKEVSKGYFSDYNQLRRSGGKLWVAPKTLLREEKSLYFPDIEGTSLLNQKVHTTDLFAGMVSIVAMTSVRSSEEHVNSFVQPTLADLKDEPQFQFIQINSQDNFLKSFLVSMFTANLRRTVPPEHQPTYLLSHQSLEYLRDPLGMTNKHIGYVYLVDSECRIRWAGCDWATTDEEEALRKCAHVLVSRLPIRSDETSDESSS